MNLLMRPSMPTTEDDRRCSHQHDRFRVLSEQHEEIARDWMSGYIPDEQLASWGPPDLSVNLLAERSEQLSRPGLYGTAPTIIHADPSAALVSEALDDMGYWPLLKRMEYLCRGMGDALVRLEWTAAGIRARLVPAHDVYVRVDPDDPMRMTEYQELRLRYSEASESWVYTWDVFNLDGPSFKVLSADRKDDLTSTYYPAVDGYPWIDEGVPFLPVIAYHSDWTGTFWNADLQRGLYHATLRAIAYGTFTGHCAHSASGPVVIAVGIAPVSNGIQIGDPRGALADAGRMGVAVRSATLPPGSIMFCEAMGEGQSMVTEVGGGQYLKTLSDFTAGYSNQQAARYGSSSADALRTSHTPMSGAAMFISNKDKRDAANSIEPSFRRSDLEALRKVAAMLRIDSRGDAPATGYSIGYVHPPESPMEEAERRASIDWRVLNGLMSRVDAYIEMNPGATREAAIAAIVQARRDEQEIQRLTEEPTDAVPVPTL